MFDQYFWNSIKIFLAIIIVINYRRILKVFAGIDKLMDKKEFSALVFLSLFVYMVVTESKSEAKIFSDYLYGITATMTLAALGFEKTLEVIKDIFIRKNNDNNTTTSI